MKDNETIAVGDRVIFHTDKGKLVKVEVVQLSDCGRYARILTEGGMEKLVRATTLSKPQS